MTVRSIAILAGSAALAVAAGVFLPPDAYLAVVAALVLIAGGAVALVMQLDRPSIALLLLVGTAVAFPLEFSARGAMVSSSLPLAAMLCGLWILRSLLARDTSAFDRSRIVLASVTFLGMTGLSFAIGQFPWFPRPGAPLPAQVVELGLFVLSVFLFLAVGQQIRRLNQLEWLTWVFVAVGTIACVVQMWPALATIGRLTTRPGSVGSIFWTFFVAITVSQGLANRDLPWPVRLGLVGLGALALGHGLIQVRSWASGWVPPLIAVGAIVVLQVPRLVVGGGLVSVPVALLVAGDLMNGLFADEAYSMTTRQEAWRVLLQIVDRSPFLGTGLTNYYYYAENFSILGWYVPFISHNNYQDLLVQTGLLGLAAFLWFGVEALLMTFRLARRCPHGFARAYALGAFGGTLGALASGMLGDWIIPFYYNGGVIGFRSSLLFWVFLGGALALRRMLTAALEAQSAADPMNRRVGNYELVPSH